MLNNTQQFWQQVKSAKAIAIIVGQEFADDGLAAALALAKILEQLAIKADIISAASESGLIDWLKADRQIKTELKQTREFVISLATTNAQVDKVKYRVEPDRLDFIVLTKNGFFNEKDVNVRVAEFAYDAIITINLSELSELGEIYNQNTDFFYTTPVINIDNQISNENFGQLNLVELTANAATEIVYQLCQEQPELITREVATCLLAGIISRTKSYRSESVTPQSLMITAELLKLGAEREVIIEKLYRNRSLATLQLWGKLLMNLQSQADDRLLYVQLTQDDLMQIDETAINQILDELIVLVPEALVLILFFDQDSKTTMAVATPKNINCLNLLKEYQVSGAKKLVWLELDKPLTEAQPEVLKLVADKLQKIN